jgi:hypothetical protein
LQLEWHQYRHPQVWPAFSFPSSPFSAELLQALAIPHSLHRRQQEKVPYSLALFLLV